MNFKDRIMSIFSKADKTYVPNVIVTKDDSTSKNKSKGEVLESLDNQCGYMRRTGELKFSEMYSFYKRDEWIRTCIDMIVGTCSKVKLEVKPVKEEKTIPAETQSHIDEVTALFDNPNGKDESFEMIRRKVLKDVLIYDAGALEIVYSNDNKPFELYDLPGDRIRISVDKHGYYNKNAFYLIPTIKTDTVWEEKNATPFKKEEVIYLMQNPRAGSVYGLSPIESLINSIESDLNASEYNANFFSNNAEPSGILNLPNLPRAELARFKEQWKRDLKTYKNAHKVFLTNIKDGIQWTKTSESAQDMQFMEYQKWLVQKILSVYKIKPFVLGLIDGTTGKLNSSEQWQAFKESAIDPLLSLESYLYTTKIINAGFGYNDIKVEFQPIDVKDEVTQAEQATKLVTAKIMTVNEVRKKYYNLPDVPWGDSPVEPIQQPQSQLNLNIKQTDNKLEKSDSSQETSVDKVQEKIKEILNRRSKEI